MADEGWENYATLSLMPAWKLPTVWKLLPTKWKLRGSWLDAAENTLLRKSEITVYASAMDSLKYFCIKKLQGTIVSLSEGNFVVVQEKPSDIQANMDMDMMIRRQGTPRFKIPKCDYFVHG